MKRQITVWQDVFPFGAKSATGHGASVGYAYRRVTHYNLPGKASRRCLHVT